MDKFLIVSIIVASVWLISLISYYFLGSDNPVEDACEGIIKAETGVDVDLSPGSPENTGNNAAS